MADGSIPPGAAAMSEAVIRADLAAAYRLVAHFGWDDLVFTHLSARIPGPEHHFLINPYGLLFNEITASNLVKIDLDGRPVDADSARVNPAGFTIHSAVHAAREDALCVMHLHTIAGTAVSCQEDGLMFNNQTSMLLHSALAYHDFEGVALNLDERPRLVADLGTKTALILRNHGTLTVGRTVGEAFTTIYFLERSCAIQVAAQGGGRLRTPPADVQHTVDEQAGAGLDVAANRLVWPAYVTYAGSHTAGFQALAGERKALLF